jgi:hypothetical protein
MIITMDRRTFLGSAGLVVATTLVPLSVVHAICSDVSIATVSTWHVDDVCGHWPPYAHPIGYGHVPAPVAVAHAEPVDHIFLA